MTFDPIMVTGNINICIVQDVSEKKCVSVYSLSKRIKFSKPHLDGNYPSKELSKPVI